MNGNELSSKKFIESFYSQFSKVYRMPVRKIILSRDSLAHSSEHFASLSGQSYPAMQLSDNSIYRYPHYQKDTDNIGQTVVVSKGTVLAVEGFEGTNAAIKRGGDLGREGAVVVKVSKQEKERPGS